MMKSIIIRFYGLWLNTLAVFAPERAGRAGFLLFCRPFRIPFTGKQKGFLNTAEKTSFHYNDQKVTVYKWGTGSKKILFLHGWQSHSYRWKAYVESLDLKQYTIYSLDAPGHGNSDGTFLSVPVYSDVIQEFLLQHDEIHTVVAHSLGSFSMLYTLYKFPLLPVKKLILMGTPGEASDFFDFFRNTLKLSNRAVTCISQHFVNEYGVGPEYFSISRFASSVNVNGLIIHDEDDEDAPYRYATYLNSAWSKSLLITTKGFGHNLRSASVVSSVVEFISENEHKHAERFENTIRS